MRVSLTLGFLLAASLPVSVHAADSANELDVRRFVQMKCGECHVVDVPSKEWSVSYTTGAPPSFHMIAHDPNMTAAKLRRALRLPSGSMATMMLTNEDIEKVVSYITGMKTQ